jgi:exopolyphosphatase/guanosine-5'-triphosphate,3'-diphosphate pyrophosphatase
MGRRSTPWTPPHFTSPNAPHEPPPAALSTAAPPGAGSADAGATSPYAMAEPTLDARRAQVIRKPPPAKFGAIDIGTNSIHLVMVEISPEGDFRILGQDKQMVQLGKGGFVDHRLTARAMSDGLAALARFLKMAQLKGVERLRAVATSAVREATNGGDFVEAVRQTLGLDVRVLSVEEEARLIYLAVRHAVDLGASDNLIIDIGGGSIELIVGNAARPELLLSAKLGSLRLAELFLRSDPPTAGQIKAMRRHIEDQLSPIVRQLGERRFARCIATSGTFQMLATVFAHRRGVKDIDPVMRLRVRRAELKALRGELSGMTRAERLRTPGVDERRIDTLYPAAILLLTLMRLLRVSEFEYCDMAMREGIIIDHIAGHRAHLLARAAWPDPRSRSVVQLAERCGYAKAHAEQVARLGLMIFDQLRPLHGLDDGHRDLLRFACLLHDVGYLISSNGHHKHSYYLIRNGRLQGFTEQEVEVLANVARYHRKGRPRPSHYSWRQLDKPDRRVVRKLAAILRIANALDRTHYSVVDGVTCRLLPGEVEMVVQAGRDAELELWTARHKAEMFEREFGLALRFEPMENVE